MCKETNVEKKTGSTVDTNPKLARDPHVQSALTMLARIDELREIQEQLEVAKAQHAENTLELAEMEEMLDHESQRVLDETIALTAFADEYDCDCGCTGAQKPSTYDDEAADAGAHSEDDEDGAPTDEDPVVRLARLALALAESWPLRAKAPRPDGSWAEAAIDDERGATRPGIAVPLLFAAIGAGGAVASIVAHWLRERKASRHAG